GLILQRLAHLPHSSIDLPAKLLGRIGQPSILLLMAVVFGSTRPAVRPRLLSWVRGWSAHVAPPGLRVYFEPRSFILPPRSVHPHRFGCRAATLRAGSRQGGLCGISGRP